MQGNMIATYMTYVGIGNKMFGATLDTGSSDFAVAASRKAGCPDWYTGECTGKFVACLSTANHQHAGVKLRAEYGDERDLNFWEGRACDDEVRSFSCIASSLISRWSWRV